MTKDKKTCPPGSDCRYEENSKDGDELFKDNWEVLVIRHDNKTGSYNWFTECCERIVNRFVNGSKSASRALGVNVKTTAGRLVAGRR